MPDAPPPAILDYARPHTLPAPLPAPRLFCLFAWLAAAAVFLPVAEHTSPWDVFLDTLPNPIAHCLGPSRDAPLGCLVLGLFLAWPLALLRTRLLVKRPWSLPARLLAAIPALAAPLPAIGIVTVTVDAINHIMPPSADEFLLLALLTEVTLLTAAGIPLAWFTARRHGLPAALYVWLLACYTAHAGLLTLFITIILNENGLHSANLGFPLYALLSLAGLTELTCWTATLRRPRAPLPTPAR